jgi:hypothetical protein
VEVKLTPRYPLFGGWSTTFLFGWSVPLSNVVRKVRLATHTPCVWCTVLCNHDTLCTPTSVLKTFRLLPAAALRSAAV